jgi:protocatechuate 3,4-dioxygenase beta subunit
MLLLIRPALVMAVFISPLLAQTARVEGTVRTLAGEPVARATIQLVNSAATMMISPNGGRGLAGFTATTDDSGKFVVENVSPGRNYRLIAMKAGFLDSSLPAQLTLNSGETIRDLVIQMAEQGVVTGRIIDVNGNPVVGASVGLQQSSYANGMRLLGSVAAQGTDDRGVYRFANVSPGRYYLGATDQTNRRGENNPAFESGQLANIQTYYPSADNIGAARSIDIPGNGAQNFDIVMRRAPTFALRGIVTDEETGAPVQGVGVVIVTINGRTIRANPYARQAERDGAFEFTGMPPASYVLEVRSVAMPGATRRIGRAEATIVGSDVSGVSIRLGNGITIRGIVQLEGGSLSPAFFTVARSVLVTEGPLRAALRLRGRVGSDGMFTMEGVPPGRFQVSFSDLPEDVYVKSIRFGDVDVLRSPLDLTAGRGGTMTITLSNKPASIDGFVRNPNGEAVNGITVVLWPKDVNGSDLTGGIRRAVTDQNSSYRFAALPPGQYYVAAFPRVEQGVLESHDFVSRFNADAARVELSEGTRVKLDAPILSGDRIAEEVANLP